MTKAEEFAEALRAELKNDLSVVFLRSGMRLFRPVEKYLHVGYFTTSEEALKTVQRTRAYRKFKDVEIQMYKLDGEAC